LRHICTDKALIIQGFVVSEVCRIRAPARWSFPHRFGYFRNSPPESPTDSCTPTSLPPQRVSREIGYQAFIDKTL
ncbi:hypothetical protein, partial [Pseudomonas sp. AD21]|uniref:hypothetical protein n=1 Tax=Pseudomonas sp. AD21 TaxID=396378 RepID=UPI001C47BCB3